MINRFKTFYQFHDMPTLYHIESIYILIMDMIISFDLPTSTSAPFLEIDILEYGDSEDG